MPTELDTKTDKKAKRKPAKRSGTKRKPASKRAASKKPSSAKAAAKAPEEPLVEESRPKRSRSAATVADTKSVEEAQQPDQSDEQLALLRELILGSYEEHVAGLQNEIVSTKVEMDDVLGKLDNLSERIDDKEALLNTISPVIANSIRSSIRDSRPEMIEAISPIMADTIRTNIRDSKDQMVEALYPIMGQLVQRAVREAMKDLVRRIDSQIQSRISFQGFIGQMRARFSGISPAELALRTSLPFDATALFLIHRHSGLLLLYASDEVVAVNPEWATDSSVGSETEQESVEVVASETEDDTNREVLEGEIVFDHAHYDTDLISGMLTAIRDFVQDAFGRDGDGHLDQVAYGDKQILIETAQNSYLAVVVEGSEPINYRAEMRDCLFDIEHEFSALLPDYDGNAAPFESKKEQLQDLLRSSTEENGGPMLTQPAQNRTLTSEADSVGESDQASKPISANVKPQNPLTEDAFGEKPNSTSLSPLSILIFVNFIILLLWWFLQ